MYSHDDSDSATFLVVLPLLFDKVGPDRGTDHDSGSHEAEHQPQVGVKVADLERCQLLVGGLLPRQDLRTKGRIESACALKRQGTRRTFSTASSQVLLSSVRLVLSTNSGLGWSSAILLMMELEQEHFI